MTYIHYIGTLKYTNGGPIEIFLVPASAIEP